MTKTIVTTAAFALIALSATACSALGNHPVPSDSTSTLTIGWEQRFSLDWSVDSAPNRTNRIRGYVTSHHGASTHSLRVLARAFDGSGAIVGQRIVWVLGGVPGFGQAYFEVRGLPVADHYGVTVWDYGIRQS